MRDKRDGFCATFGVAEDDEDDGDGDGDGDEEGEVEGEGEVKKAKPRRPKGPACRRRTRRML